MNKIKVFVFILLISLLSACDSTEEYYVGMVSIDNKQLLLDDYEFLVKGKDDSRLKELNIADDRMPNGYYIHNESAEILKFQITNETKFTFYDTRDLFHDNPDNKLYSTTDIAEFKQFLNPMNKPITQPNNPRTQPFWITVKGNKVISVVEEFVN